jgi:hypothetical protein
MTAVEIPLDAVTGPWAGIISLSLFFGILGVVWSVETIVAKWRRSGSSRSKIEDLQ